MALSIHTLIISNSPFRAISFFLYLKICHCQRNYMPGWKGALRWWLRCICWRNWFTSWLTPELSSGSGLRKRRFTRSIPQKAAPVNPAGPLFCSLCPARLGYHRPGGQRNPIWLSELCPQKKLW